MNNKRPHVSYKTDETFDLNKIHSYGCMILVYRQLSSVHYCTSICIKCIEESTVVVDDGFLVLRRSKSTFFCLNSGQRCTQTITYLQLPPL